MAKLFQEESGLAGRSIGIRLENAGRLSVASGSESGRAGTYTQFIGDISHEKELSTFCIGLPRSLFSLQQRRNFTGRRHSLGV